MWCWVTIPRLWGKALVPVQEHGSAVPSSGDVPWGERDSALAEKQAPGTNSSSSLPLQLKSGGDKQRV